MTQSVFLDRRGFITYLVGTSGLAFVGCSSESEEEQTIPRTPVTLEPLDTVILTTERTIVPTKPHQTTLDPRSPIDPEGRALLIEDGYDEYEYGPGEPIIERMPEGHTVGNPGAGRKVLTRFDV